MMIAQMKNLEERLGSEAAEVEVEAAGGPQHPDLSVCL